MLPISAHGCAEDRGLSFRLFQLRTEPPDQTLQFRDPFALQLPPQASDQTLEFRDPLVGVDCGGVLFCLEYRTGLLRELLLPIREQALVDPQFVADPRHASRVLQNLQDGARFTLRGEIEDRRSRVEGRFTRNYAILDPRSTIHDPGGFRDLLGSAFPGQTLRLFVDGVLILRSQRPEEERPDYVNERKNYRARAEYDDRMRGGDQGPDGGRSDHRHDDGRRRVGDRRELSEVFPLHAELAADGGHAYRDVEHAKAGGSGRGPYKPAEFDAHVKRDAGEWDLRQVEFEAEVPEIGDRSHDRGGQYHLR